MTMTLLYGGSAPHEHYTHDDTIERERESEKEIKWEKMSKRKRCFFLFCFCFVYIYLCLLQYGFHTNRQTIQLLELM